MNEVTTVETPATTAVVKVDNGRPALFNPAIFDQIWRAATLFSKSDLVPATYKNKPENCFIAIEMAERMGINPFAVMQNLAIIQGKPAMEAKLIIALVNDSGIFVDPIEYEIVGDDPHADTYQVRAFATMAKTGKKCLGPWITWKMVKGEGWLSKQGSKWATMPSIMFMYRAASFFAKVYAPNITMGMQTREEMEDITPIDPKEIPVLVDMAPVQEPASLPPAQERPKRGAGKKKDEPVQEAAPAVQEVEGEVVDTGTGEVFPGDEEWPDLPNLNETPETETKQQPAKAAPQAAQDVDIF